LFEKKRILLKNQLGGLLSVHRFQDIIIMLTIFLTHGWTHLQIDGPYACRWWKHRPNNSYSALFHISLNKLVQDSTKKVIILH